MLYHNTFVRMSRWLHIFYVFMILFLAACGSSKKANTGNTIKAKKPALPADVISLCAQFELEPSQVHNAKLYQVIYDWLGVPHKDNGCEKSGTDCSCFVKMVYNTVYKTDIGKHSKEMYDRTMRIQKNQLQEGDLVFFVTKGKSVSHVGIYLHNQKFAHVSAKKGVHINSLQEAYYQKTYSGAGRRPKP